MREQWLESLPIRGVIKTEPLLRGVANNVYKITTTQAKYILKQFRFDHPYGLDREQEVRVQQQLAQYQLAPEVIHYDAPQGLVLQSFLDEPDLAHTKLPMADKLRELADVSAHIHRLSVDVPVWSLRERLQRYCLQLAEFDAERAQHFSTRLELFRKLLDSFAARPVFCHNDLGMHHIFITPTLRVIDWEYAGLGERYFDLANTMAVNELDLPQRNAFINAYESAAGFAVDRPTLENWRELVALVNQLWYELHHYLQRITD
ncbi:phosphotransferase [Pseudidiomarina sp. 1APP75-32.1]|uniref:Phosphotransferase n=1 Tax=Pseudidiomarina terrestris TaxID=2820060 RepID=A0AAW7QYY0_9GAMM|nr:MULTISPECIES: phosphotransferase [unclassified Pseudidiomarina]MDN7124964.1 phosphotransferase [Pseudidiomarina sp. 1APP75-32.1]MDN7129561.1 phosphotransferase [Pseudidiomarina sp. 1APR75-15]